MKALFDKMLAALHGGTSAVLCIIVASSGSVPRGAGAKMAVFPDGSIAGTIGGGTVEYLAIQRALAIHAGGADAAERFVLRPNQVQDIGMVCGGEVTVHFRRFDPDDPEGIALLEHLLSLVSRNCRGWLIMALQDGRISDIGTWDDTDGMRFLREPSEGDVLPHLCSRAVLVHGDPTLYIEPISRPGMVYIFGGGHVGQALCPVLAGIDFRVTMVENRPSLRDARRFPGAVQVLHDDCADIRATIPITSDDYVVIMTPGHADDRGILDQALWTPARYIGLIGSRKKLAATRAYLLERGHDEASLSRIHSPIGLSIGAETPQEIAISIAAELIAERAGR